MKRLRHWVTVAAATTALAAGSVVAANVAHADPYYPSFYCLPTASGWTIASTPYGGAWVDTGQLVESVYGATPAGGWGVVNCRYEGRVYEWWIGGSRQTGTVRWLNPNQRRVRL